MQSIWKFTIKQVSDLIRRQIQSMPSGKVDFSGIWARKFGITIEAGQLFICMLGNKVALHSAFVSYFAPALKTHPTRSTRNSLHHGMDICNVNVTGYRAKVSLGRSIMHLRPKPLGTMFGASVFKPLNLGSTFFDFSF